MGDKTYDFGGAIISIPDEVGPGMEVIEGEVMVITDIVDNVVIIKRIKMEGGDE